MTDIINQKSDVPVGDILKKRVRDAKDNLEQKIKKITGSGLGLKRKRKPK
jgi:hypothetical protein